MIKGQKKRGQNVQNHGQFLYLGLRSEFYFISEEYRKELVKDPDG